MNFSDKKIEIAVVSLVVILVGGIGYLIKDPVQTALAQADFVYEMPRPKSLLASLFGLRLEGREVSRSYVNPFAKKKQDEKKAEEKKAAAVAAAKAAQAKADAKKSADAAKKPKVEMKVVGADSSVKLGQDSSGNFGANGGAKYSNAANVAQTTNSDQIKDGLSGDQWRALLSSQPTKENVAKLINAYFAKEVDDSTFYTIVTDLLRNNKTETQALGLYAVSSIYNLQSFTAVAGHYDQMTSENQAKAYSYLTGYATSSRSGVLLSALKTNEAVVVDLAIQVVVKGYQSAKTSGTAATDPRSSRGDVNAQANSVSDYSKFLPVFRQLAQSSDSTIAGLASSALNQIQTSVAAL